MILLGPVSYYSTCYVLVYYILGTDNALDVVPAAFNSTSTLNVCIIIKSTALSVPLSAQTPSLVCWNSSPWFAATWLAFSIICLAFHHASVAEQSAGCSMLPTWSL